jgi:hypothetical protein
VWPALRAATYAVLFGVIAAIVSAATFDMVRRHGRQALAMVIPLMLLLFMFAESVRSLYRIVRGKSKRPFQ